MSVTVLEEAMERLGTVPSELRRILDFVKVTDERWRSNMERLKTKQKDYINAISEAVKPLPKDGSVDLTAVTATKQAAFNEIQALRQLVMGLAEEKVSAAQQAFDLLDNHIRKLDGDISTAADALRAAGQEVPHMQGYDDYGMEPYDDGRSKIKGRKRAYEAPLASPTAPMAGLARQSSTSQFSVSADASGSHMPMAPASASAVGRDISMAVNDLFQGSSLMGYPAASPTHAHGTNSFAGASSFGAPGATTLQRNSSTQSVSLAPHMAGASLMSPPAGGTARNLSAAPGIGALAAGFGGQRTDGYMMDEVLDPAAAGDGERYCLCDKPAFGEMVACDNPHCEKEWFHLECVGLKAAPSGKWFCPLCKKKEKTGGPAKRR